MEQVEELEGGVIKESKTGMAATQRADRRKRKSSHDGGYKLAIHAFTIYKVSNFLPEQWSR